MKLPHKSMLSQAIKVAFGSSVVLQNVIAEKLAGRGTVRGRKLIKLKRERRARRARRRARQHPLTLPRTAPRIEAVPSQAKLLPRKAPRIYNVALCTHTHTPTHHPPTPTLTPTRTHTTPTPTPTPTPTQTHTTLTLRPTPKARLGCCFSGHIQGLQKQNQFRCLHDLNILTVWRMQTHFS